MLVDLQTLLLLKYEIMEKCKKGYVIEDYNGMISSCPSTV